MGKVGVEVCALSNFKAAALIHSTYLPAALRGWRPSGGVGVGRLVNCCMAQQKVLQTETFVADSGQKSWAILAK